MCIRDRLSVIPGLRILNIHHERGPDALGIPHGRGRAHPLFRGATAKTIIAFLPRKDQRKLYDGHAAEICLLYTSTAWR